MNGFYEHAGDGERHCRLCRTRLGSGHSVDCPLLLLRLRMYESVSQLGLYVVEAREHLDEMDRLLRGDEVML